VTREVRGAETVLSCHVDAAAGALDAAAGSSSLCSLSRAGIAIPGIKYPEGAWAALRDVKRATGGQGDVAVAAAQVRQRWAADLALHQERNSGSDWVSYLTGGVDAIDGLLAEITPDG
jgi:hypothetical protein